MQSNGGMMSAEDSRKLSVNTILSGPAAGVIAATRIARESGFKNLIAYDMGGTSLDVSLVVRGYYDRETAKQEYGVLIREDGEVVDAEGTGRLRAELRAR